MEELINLKGKTAIITGASSGIGRATALFLAKNGAEVVLAARRVERLESLAKEIEKEGQKAFPIKVDVTVKSDIQRLVSEAVNRFGKIDILVNNAGVLDFKNFLDLDDESWNKILNVNLRGYYWTAFEVVKEMVKKKYGKIVNVASIAGLAAFPQITPYNISKAAVIMLTKSMATELGPFGINVNAVAPGIISTEMTEGMLKDPKTMQNFLDRIPIGRVGKAEEIASVVGFLVSDLANYMTGTTVIVDGGWTCHL